MLIGWLLEKRLSDKYAHRSLTPLYKTPFPPQEVGLFGA